MIAASHRQSGYPVITEHNVAVYRELPNGDWEMSSDESGRFAYRPCDDADRKGATAMLREGVGYIALRAVWQEQGNCRSLNGPGLNFYWTTGNDQFRRITDVRPTDPLH